MSLDAVVYTTDGVELQECATADQLAAARDRSGTTWVRASAPTDDELDRLLDAFGLHPLAVEDVHNAVRPKTEQYDGYTFVLVKTARLERGETTFDEEIAEGRSGCSSAATGW